MTGLDLSVARTNMITNQVRAWDVDDARVLELLARTPREEYAPLTYRNLAYADMAIPLGHGQQMFAPKIEARFLQALDVQPTDQVLEVGTGSGYMAALLAGLSAYVTSVEIIPELARQARAVLAGQGVGNVRVEVGDGSSGWPRHAPYDVILLTGSMEVLPDGFRQMLKPGGRMGVVVGVSPAMSALLMTNSGVGLVTETLFETDLPPLINARQAEHFVF